jgi:hypothetical protein
MSKYTADDNRSMQLNDNNDRYYSSRDIDRHDNDDDDTCSYQMPIGNIMRKLNDDSRRERSEHMSHACPHGCHEQSNYYPHQYSQFKCHHQKIKKDIPRLLRRLKWAEAQLGEPLPQNETRENQKLMVYWERKTYNDALKV